MIIHLIASPRNVSTALMYSMGQHADIYPIDEPFYGRYLIQSGKNHPGRKMVLKNHSSDREKVFHTIQAAETEYPVVLIKNMAHHIQENDLECMKNWWHVFLIRHPRLHIRSFSKVIPEPMLDDLWTTSQRMLYDILLEQGHHPYVMDSNILLGNPEKELRQLCKYVNIEFYQEMLTWPSGPKSFDGCWAPHWYQNAWASTKFGPPTNPESIELPGHLQPLLEACMVDYQYLYNHIK